MDQFEIKSKYTNYNISGFLMAFLIIMALIGWPILSSKEEILTSLNYINPFFLVVGGVIIFGFVYLLFIGIYSKNRKIRVDNNLIYFMKKTLFKGWKIDGIVDFSHIIGIKDRIEKHFTGKILITYYWMVFELDNGSTQEMFISPYGLILENFLFYIRGRYPKIKIESEFFKKN